MEWTKKQLIIYLLLPMAVIVGWATTVRTVWTGLFFAVTYAIFATMVKYVLFDD